jgi:hypothetical protein
MEMGKHKIFEVLPFISRVLIQTVLFKWNSIYRSILCIKQHGVCVILSVGVIYVTDVMAVGIKL